MTQMSLIEKEMNKQLSLVNKSMTPSPNMMADQNDRLQTPNLVTPMSSQLNIGPAGQISIT